MLRIAVCFLLVFLNVLFAFESHIDELTLDTNQASLAQFHSSGSCNDGDHSSTETTQVEHACHSHCSFISNTFKLAAPEGARIFIDFKSKDLPLAVLDRNIRPPIRS